MAKVKFFDADIEGKLDQNPDLLGCLNGVIELKSGDLREGRPEDYLSQTVSVEYSGLDLPTPTVDSFFDDILNADMQYISFMQVLLGYGVTGHTTDQVDPALQACCGERTLLHSKGHLHINLGCLKAWLRHCKTALFVNGLLSAAYAASQLWFIWHGLGSNGKGVLLAALKKLLGKLLCVASEDVFYVAEGRTSAGAHSAHLQDLKGARIVALDESAQSSQLNATSLKRLTSDTLMKTRGCYG